jgi:hypothetical protein
MGYSALRAVVNDWRTSGTVQHHSGDALTAWMGTDNSSTGLLQDRAQRDFTQNAYLKTKIDGGDCAAGKLCESWFNPSAFSVPLNSGPGTGFGNVIKDSLRGPGFTVWNAALTRSFPIYRETTLDFRAEYFDLLNHTILANPSTADPISSSTSFGTITSENSAGPRVAQFALKYVF